METPIPDNDNIKEKAKRIRRKAVKVDCPTPAPKEGSPDVVADERLEQYVKQISEEMRKSIDAQIKEHKEEEKMYRPLENILEEYMRAYVLIGYTVEGERIVIGRSNTRLDQDALTEHLRAYFIRIMSQGQGD